MHSIPWPCYCTWTGLPREHVGEILCQCDDSALLVQVLYLRYLYLLALTLCTDWTGTWNPRFQKQLLRKRQWQNRGSLCRQPVKLIFWMMVTGGENMGRKWWKEILIQGCTFCLFKRNRIVSCCSLLLFYRWLVTWLPSYLVLCPSLFLHFLHQIFTRLMISLTMYYQKAWWFAYHLHQDM